ncbi:MAG: tyrosine-type recombinase/integrase [Acidobacteriaceae bacterium]
MSVYKRGGTYWMEVTFNGHRYRKTTNEKNRRNAEAIEAAFRTQLAKGEVGIEDAKPAPRLREFAQSFIDFVQTRHANKPETVKFYANRLKRLLEWEPLRETRLDRIDESLIEQYIGVRRKSVGVVAVNRELATLRRILHVAHDWKLLKNVPKIRLLPGEASRDYVLDHETEQRYLEACSEAGLPVLHDVAIVLLDSALRLGEALALEWSAVHLEPAGSARYGWIQVTDGKTKNARRTVPLAARVGRLLAEKRQAATAAWVFPGESPDKPVLGTSLAHMHTKVCRPGQGKKRRYLFPRDFVLHSLRHTCLTRQGEAGADAFTIMKLAGHSSVTVSQRYVHPTGETVQLAFDRLETLNRRALKGSKGKHHPQNHPQRFLDVP